MSKFDAHSKIVINQAREDPAFRKRLLEDPVAAISELEGVAPRSGITINIFEDSPREIHVVLPPLELSDEDLQSAVGGFLDTTTGYDHSVDVDGQQIINEDKVTKNLFGGVVNSINVHSA